MTIPFHRLALAGVLAIGCLGPVNHGVALADPVVDTPRGTRGVLHRDESGDARFAVIGDIALVAALIAEPAAEYPELGHLDPVSVTLSSARLGLLGTDARWRYVLRVDLAEAWRLDERDYNDEPAAVIGRYIDDAYVAWLPRSWVGVRVGRFKVPHSRFRQLERTRTTPFAVPLVVDRLAPDRRWGAALHGDLGALAYAVGAFADNDFLELRRERDPASDPLAPPDPSLSGRVLTTGYLWWTPRAPIGADHIATPPSDPWFPISRPAAGIGVSWRERAGSDRLDVSFALQLAYRRYAAIVELLAYSDDATLGLGAAMQVSALMTDRAVIYALGEYDTQPSLWSAGGGASLFVTSDRLNKIGLVGLLRRPTHGGPVRDALLLQLQTSL